MGTATTAVGGGQHRARRPATYGKRVGRVASTYDFPMDLDGPPTPPRGQSRLKTPTSTPKRSRISKAPDTEAAVFDVESSDDDARARTVSKLSFQPSRRIRKNSQASLRPSELITSSQVPREVKGLGNSSTANKGKRKELDETDESKARWLATEGTKPTSQVRNDVEKSHDLGQRPRDVSLVKPDRQPQRDLSAPITFRSHSGPGNRRLTAKGGETRPIPLANPDLASKKKAHSQSAPAATEISSAGAITPRTTPPPVQSPTRSPLTAMKLASIRTTPKQAKLWSTLLDNDDSDGLTPTQDFGKMEIASLTRASRQLPRRRLVDSLKAPDDIDEASDSEDMEMFDAIAEPSHHNSQQEISSSQPAAVEGAPRLLVPSSGSYLTYGGERTFLPDEPLSMEEMLSQPLELDDGASFGLSDNPYGVSRLDMQSKEDGALEDEASAKIMRSVHELRAAGENRRFDNSMSALVEDLQGSDKASLSKKRSALLNLCNKLMDPQFRLQFTQHSSSEEVFRRCRDSGDLVVGVGVAAAVALICTSLTAASAPAQIIHAGIIPLLCRVMEDDRDLKTIARERKSNMSKVAQTTFMEFQDGILASSVWDSGRPTALTPRLMSLRATESLFRWARESGMAQGMLDAPLLENLLCAVENGGEQANTTNGQPPWHKHVEMSLSTLEYASIAPACALDAELWNEAALRRLVMVLTNMLEAAQSTSISIDPLIFRICLNLANNSRHNSDAFADTSFVGNMLRRIYAGFVLLAEMATADDDPRALDATVLGLGAMINLAEWSEAVREASVGLEAALYDLVRLFVKSRDKSQEAVSLEASRANVAYGWLSVLLGNLCQSRTVRLKILEMLPGRRLGIVIDAVEEFVLYHKEADRSEDGNETWAAFTARLQHVAQSLRRL